MGFTHLHCHSYFSLMRGTVSVEALVEAASRMGMEALALTDVNGLYGWVEFVQHCEASGIRPLCGVDLKAADSSAVLLAKDPQGYSRICRLISDYHLAGETPSVQWTEGFTWKGVPGQAPPPPFMLRQALLEDRGHLAVLSRDAELLAALARESGPRDLYAEVIPGCENLPLLKAARTLGVPPVAANDVYFLHPDELKTHRLLRAIDENTTLYRAGLEPRISGERLLHDEAAMRRGLSYVPEAVGNAAALAASLACDWRLGATVFPPFEEFSHPEAYFTLRWKCYQGARWRYGTLRAAVVERLEHELKVIREKGFTHYFLVVDDIVRQAPRTCGRGSVAASLVSYCLGITHVDPIAHHLMFERFLNARRRDPPDADIDFPWDERDAILDYAFKKYNGGAERGGIRYRAAMVANHVRLQARAAVREVAKVHGIGEEEIKRMSFRLFRSPPKSLPPPWDEIVRGAERVHELPRHLSVHCGGLVIVPDDLRRYVPLERATKGVNVIQWEKDQTEDFGLVKIDILGNRSLAVIRDALEEIRLHTGRQIEYVSLDPTQDPATQQTVRRGDTMGVFYIESPATRQLQEKADVGDYEHLIIHSSIIRPAAHRLINEYVRRLHGKPYQPVHPLLDETLKETYGIMVYQEDVTKAAMAVAGFDAVDADGLRKALSRKRPHRRLEEYRRQFLEGALGMGVARPDVERIWEMILSFAGYSFCKPHSASYALVSFQAAFLRTHYPAEFMAAVLSNGGGYYSSFAYLSEARRMGLTILPLEVNHSNIAYSGKGGELRIGLMQLQGFQSKSMKALIEARQRGGAFASLEDFLDRVKLELSDLKILIKAGGFDGIAGRLNRPQLLWKLLQLHRGKVRSEASPGLPLQQAAAVPWIPPVKDYTEAEKLVDEQASFNFLISRHPLSLYRRQLERVSHLEAAQMKAFVGHRVAMVGMLIADKVVSTVHDEAMAFMSFEDLTALYETVFFPRAYRDSLLKLNSKEPFLLHGKVEEDLGAVTLHVERIISFTDLSKIDKTL